MLSLWTNKSWIPRKIPGGGKYIWVIPLEGRGSWSYTPCCLEICSRQLLRVGGEKVNSWAFPDCSTCEPVGSDSKRKPSGKSYRCLQFKALDLVRRKNGECQSVWVRHQQCLLQSLTIKDIYYWGDCRMVQTVGYYPVQLKMCIHMIS